jgi:hypothetical protein
MRPAVVQSCAIKVLALVLLSAAAWAAPVTWTFDLATTGQDVFWTSPTPVDPAANWYVVSWNISLVEVTLKPPFFPEFTVNVTDQIPPEDRIGTNTHNGPAPILAFNNHVAYPAPPAQPAIEADVQMGLDAAGYGYANVTNVVLGTLVYQGVPMQVKRIHMAGTITAEAYFGSTVLGDLNCDYAVAFDDIDPFILALSGFEAYHAAYPNCNWLNADCNGDGVVNFDDIDPFVAILSGGQ